MMQGKTKSGFAYSIPESRLDNMELLEVLVDIDKGNGTQLPDALEMLLGRDQKQALYDHVRNSEGIVPVSAVSAELMEILQENRQAKNC